MTLRKESITMKTWACIFRFIILIVIAVAGGDLYAATISGTVYKSDGVTPFVCCKIKMEKVAS